MQSHRDARLPIAVKLRSNPGQGHGMRSSSGAVVSFTERLPPRLNLRRSTRVGAPNEVSLSEERDERTSQK